MAKGNTPVIDPEQLSLARLRSLIYDVPNFPKPGITFKDITPLLRSPSGLSLAMEFLAQPFRGMHVDAVGGAESRGFIFAMAVASKLSAGFVPFRKPGRLPREGRSQDYMLEYGAGRLEVHVDAVRPGDRILLVDDLLATGGTMVTCKKLVNSLGGIVVGMAFLIELGALGGRAALGEGLIYSVLHYD
jgi:adenine phosphoribosyltransferase